MRRQSIDPDDLRARRMSAAMDLCARALLDRGEDDRQDGALAGRGRARYAGWHSQLGRDILDGRASLDDLARRVAQDAIEPQPVSGRQERLEHLVNSYL